MENKKVAFNISGDYITDLMRDWFYEEGKPYSKIEETLLDCLVCDDLSLEERKQIAKDILIGTKKLTGNTGDNTYRIEDDNVTHIFLSKVTKLVKELNDTKQELQEANNKYLDLYDGVCNKSIDGIQYLDNKKVLKSAFSIYETPPLIKDIYEADKFEDNYGWLKPTGEFIPVKFGDHQEFAQQVVDDNNWEDDLWKEFPKNEHHPETAGDFLCYVKGWILLDNPRQGTAKPTIGKNPTKAQKEFLFDYYIKRDRNDLANKYFSE